MAYRNIVAALDIHDVENAKSALEGVRSIVASSAFEEPAKVTIVYVRHHLPANYSTLISADFDTEEMEEANRTIGAWAVESGLDYAKIVTSRGRVSTEVIDHAVACEADVIVIGSRRPSLSTRLLGSNAGAIVRDSPISVFVVR